MGLLWHNRGELSIKNRHAGVPHDKVAPFCITELSAWFQLRRHLLDSGSCNGCKSGSYPEKFNSTGTSGTSLSMQEYPSVLYKTDRTFPRRLYGWQHVRAFYASSCKFCHAGFTFRKRQRLRSCHDDAHSWPCRKCLVPFERKVHEEISFPRGIKP